MDLQKTIDFLCRTFLLFFHIFTNLFTREKDTWKQAIQVAIQLFASRQSTVILTTFIILAFFLLLLLLTNRFWYVFSFTLVIDLLLTVSTVIKYKLREEPVYPSDLKMLNGLSELLAMVSPVIIISGIVIVLFLTISSIIIQRKLQHRYALKFNWKKITGIAILTVMLSGVFFINHKNSPSYLLFNLFRVNKTFFNQKDAVRENG
ncbi:hypothetical protein GQR36_14355 [Enterococcus termitis]